MLEMLIQGELLDSDQSEIAISHGRHLETKPLNQWFLPVW